MGGYYWTCQASDGDVGSNFFFDEGIKKAQVTSRFRDPDWIPNKLRKFIDFKAKEIALAKLVGALFYNQLT